MLEDDWTADYSNIVLTAEYLARQVGASTDTLLHFIEKPHHYEAEFLAAKAEADQEDEIEQVEAEAEARAYAGA